MKKLLFLLLATVVMHGQTYQNPTFGTVKTMTAPTVTTTPHLGTVEANGTISKITPENLPISTATINALELKTENSAGAISGFGITNNGNGTVNIASGVALLRIANTPTATLIKFPIPAVTNLALTDNANNYVLVDYNGGTPAITVTTSPGTINTTTNSLIYVISRVGNTLDYVPLVGQNVDANAKLRRRFLNSEGLNRAYGAVLNGVNRNLTVTAGLYNSGLIEVPTPAFNTSTGSTFTQVYENGSTWVRTTGNTQINNTQYNNAGVLTNMPTNDYRVDYVYILANNPSKLYVILGNTTYANIANARLAPVPANLPSELQAIGTRIGRVIIQRLATTMEVSSEFATVYNAGSATLHNDLGGLNAGDFQHLTAAEKATVEYTTNKSSTLTASSVLYPNNNAVIAGLAAKANDADVVHKTGNIAETITGPKTFNSSSATVFKRGSIADIDDIILGQNGAGTNTFSVSGSGNSKSRFFEIEENGIGSDIYRIYQPMAESDYWAIYGRYSTVDRAEMVFELGDNGEPFSGIGQRFLFNSKGSSSGADKTHLNIEYDNTFSYNHTILSPFVSSGDVDGLSIIYNPDNASNRLRAKMYVQDFKGKILLKNNMDIQTVLIDSGGDSYLNGGGLTVGGSISATNYTGGATLTGTPTAPTAPAGTNTTQIATMEALQTAITNNGIITTSTSVTNTTLTDSSLPQNGKTLLIANGASNINYTVNGSITASFVKGGTGSITFVQGSGRTMVAANGTLVFNGSQYSTASIVSFGTTDIVYINNF